MLHFLTISSHSLLNVRITSVSSTLFEFKFQWQNVIYRSWEMNFQKESLIWTPTRVIRENPVTTDFFMLPLIIFIFRIFKPITSSEIPIEYSSEESDCIPGISGLIGRQVNSEPLRVRSKGRLENSKIPSKIGQWRVADWKWWIFHFLIFQIFDPENLNPEIFFPESWKV